ncbi:MAG: ATP-binding cassette domain-containing protein, partial [Clostridia bacterium]|nr:ATP-binding cassette domain-containing protein [Clostridia bacterium]
SVLGGLGLNRESLRIPLSKLSGGEKLRVLLARVVISRPDVLILDEPTNHLDIRALEWLEKYLLGFKGGVLLVSHDRYFLDKVATRVIELEFGTVRGMRSSYSDYLEQKKVLKDFNRKKQQDIERQIRNEKKIVQTLRHQRKISAFNSRLKKIDKLEDKLQQLKKEGAALHLGRIPSVAINMGHHVHVSDEAAYAKGLGKRFGNRILFEDANFLIKGGEKVGIIGDNGSGKTTLLNILSGKETDITGEASIGQWIKYGFISQDIVFEDDSLTVLEKIMLEAKLADYGDMTVKQALEYAAHYKFYGEETGKKLSVLSGGEKSRLALAVVMLAKPNCLVMDEPTNHLDIYTREVMESAFEEFRGTIIAISHDRYLLDNCINRILAIEDGTIKVIDGNYSKYFELKKPEQDIPVQSAEDKKRLKYEKHMEIKRLERLKKAKAQRKKLMQETESRIEELEDFKQDFEKNMGENTTYEAYLDYQEKMALLEKLYQKWEKMNTD